MPFLQDLSKTAKKVLDEATHAAAQARRAAGEATDANRDKIEAAIEKAGRLVDTKTEGKYGSTIAKAKDAATKGVDLVAKQKSTVVPPRPTDTAGQTTRPGAESPWAGGNATWQDDSIQDTVQDRIPGQATGGYPNPVPPYEPPAR